MLIHNKAFVTGRFLRCDNVNDSCPFHIIKEAVSYSAVVVEGLEVDKKEVTGKVASGTSAEGGSVWQQRGLYENGRNHWTERLDGLRSESEILWHVTVVVCCSD